MKDKIQVLDIFVDRTADIQQNREHQVQEVYTDGFGRIAVVKFSSGLTVGEPPFDWEWSIDWPQFRSEFFMILTRDEALSMFENGRI